MSTGNIIGTIVGGVAGFFIGGPMGAIYGAGMGFSLGGLIDPQTPDVPTPGVPDTAEIVMSSTVGDPVPDVLGTSQITGHLLAYGKERTVEITETYEAQSGKGGGGSSSQTYTVGWEYYMTWVLGICAGPVNILKTVFKGDDVVWEGTLLLEDAVNGQETITLDGMGSCTFYFGTSDQLVNSVVGEIIPNPDYNTPYRNFCYAVLDDCLIGATSPRCPSLSFVLSKHPECSIAVGYEIIQSLDYNPIHAIWYSLNTLCGLSGDWLDTDSFEEAAAICQNENKGISILFSRQQSALEYLTSINTHSNCNIIYGFDGKFHAKLIRDDYIIDDLPIIEESIIVDEPTFQRDSWVGTKNEIKVQYTEIVDRPYVNNLYTAGHDYLGALMREVIVEGMSEEPSFDLVTEVKHIVSVSPSSQSVFFLITATGGLYVCGGIPRGGLGLGDIEGSPGSPITQTGNQVVRVLPEGSGVVSVKCSGSHTIILKDDSTLWSTGDNSAGQLCLGDFDDRSEFTLIGPGYHDFCVGYYNTWAIDNEVRQMYSCGIAGPLTGHGDWVQRSSLYPINVEANPLIQWETCSAGPSGWHCMAIDTSHNLWAAGSNTSGECCMSVGADTQFPVFTQTPHNGIVQVVTPFHSTIFLNSEGIVRCQGNNFNGQLGTGSFDHQPLLYTLPNIKARSIGCSEYSSLIIDESGVVYGAGVNLHGNLGRGTLTAKEHTFAVASGSPGAPTSVSQIAMT